MQRRLFFSAAVFGLLVSFGEAQILDWQLGVVGRGMLTTSSRIYPYPDAPSFDLRTRNTPFSSGYGGGVELRVRRFDDNYFFYLAGEYLSQSRSEFKLDGSLSPPSQVPVDEGYLLIPIETGGQVYIPLGSQRWRLSMGGGVGMYFAERILTVAGVRAAPEGDGVGFGIHVGLNVEYSVRSGVSVTAGVKFRDPEVDVANRFESPSTTYGNNTVVFPQGELKSRINVDGLTVHVGVIVEIT